jgi:TP901 family phage tail tape measure protein
LFTKVGENVAKDMETKIKVGLDTVDFNGSVTEINRRLKVLDAEFKNTSEQAKSFGTATDELRIKQENLTQKVELQSAKVAKLKEAYDKAKTAKGEDSKQTQNLAIQYNRAEESLTKMQSSLKDTTDKIEKQAEKLEQLKTKLSNVSDKAKSFGEGFSKAGDGLLKITAPMAAIGVLGGKVALDFQETMAKVSTVFDETQVSLKDLGNGVIDLSNKYGKSSEEIGEALYQTISAGISTSESMNFMNTSLKTARGGFTDTVSAVDALTNVLMAYGMKAKDVTKISDQMFVMQNIGKITIGEVATEIGRVAPLASAAKVSTDELFTSLAVLTKNGIQSEEAITGLKAILSNIAKPTQEAKEAARGMGLQFSLSAVQAKGFAGFLSDIVTKTGGSQEKMVQLFGSVEAVNSIFALTSKTGSKDFKTTLELMKNSAGETDKAFNKMNTSGFTLAQAIERIKNVGVNLLPLAEAVLNIINPIATLISKIPAPILQISAVIGMVGVAIGSVLKIVGSTSLAVSNITNLFGGFNIATMRTVAIVIGVVAALTALAAIIAIIMNRDIAGQMNSIGSAVNSMTNSVNSNVPRSAYHAKGGTIRGDQWGIVNEEGGEIQYLRDGTTIIPHDISMEMARSSNENRSGETYNFHAGSIVIDAKNVNDFNKVVQIVKSLKQTKNAGTVIG